MSNMNLSFSAPQISYWSVVSGKWSVGRVVLSKPNKTWSIIVNGTICRCLTLSTVCVDK